MSLDAGAHLRKNIQNRRARGIQSDILNENARFRKKRSGGDEKYRGRNIAGNIEVACSQFDRTVGAGAANFRYARVAFDGSAKFLEREFRVIPRARRLGDNRFAFGKKSREQHGGLHLRAGHRHFVLDGAQLSAANFERREIIFARFDFRAHFAQRPDDTFHRPLLQAVVSADRGLEILAGQNSGKKANRGAGISRVERAPAALQSVQTVAGNANGGAIDFHLRAKGLHAG